MYVVIVGAGRVGVSMARWLVAAEHEIVVIDRDASRCEKLDEELGSITIAGDGTEAGVLEAAGTSRADILIAATGKDEDNLVACQLAKHRFKVSVTVSLVNIREHEELFNLLGIDVKVETTGLIASRIQEELAELLVEEVGDLR